ncbi:MBL fold metallo-hydrolase [Gryllotalpicola ginsengisoli]|uniref:MBL fold metallo-hydrolase n=1 Tax=Gryllotalpicola ginsengisoli TaxID=444608 RepID=UPI0003B6F0BC|nr:MBL fold metallo-hydrolase [Gryllotalpicola ginsengisoli]
MRITKLEHAAFVLDKDGAKLVVDPGNYSRPVPDPSDVAGVVITHEHADHWDPPHLEAIVAANPGVAIFGTQGVKDAASDFDVTVVKPGDHATAGPFELDFVGGRHNEIHRSIPIVDNVGVVIDGGAVYFPGDSYAVPEGVEVDVLAAPSSAPWLKIGEAMDFVLAVKPRRAFPTHEMINSELGKQMAKARIAWAAEQNAGSLLDLEPGDTVEL